MYEKILELSTEFNEMLSDIFRLFPFLFCCLLTIAILFGGIIAFIEYLRDKCKKVKNERE